MRRKCSNIGRKTRNARRNRLYVKKETEEERELRLAKSRDGNIVRRNRETPIEREHRLSREREIQRVRRARELYKRKKNAKNTLKSCNNEVHSDMNVDSSSIEYKDDPSIDYKYESVVSLGTITVICENCSASIWKGESKGLCCLPAQVKLEEDLPPLEPTHSFQTPKCEAGEGS